ncbi:MAG: molybdate transport system permease protein [Myxococcota bacterium]
MIDVVLLSVEVAVLAVLICVLPATATAWVLARKRFRGRAVLDAVVHLPLVLPPVVTGYVLLLLLGPQGPLGGLGLGFSTGGAAVAAAAVSFPLFVRPIRQGFEALDDGLLEAAQSLGASPWRAFWTITLPLARPGLIAGTLLAFGRSLGEFGATITFVGSLPGETRTLPLALHEALQTPDGESQALAFALVSTGLAFVTLLVGEWIARRPRWTRSQ